MLLPRRLTAAQEHAIPPSSCASMRVLTDSMLFHRITAYQAGIPVSLYHMWAAYNHKIKRCDHLQAITDGLPELVERTVRYGNVHTLELIAVVRIHDPEEDNQWVTPYLDVVPDRAVQFDRPDMLEWAITHGMVASPTDQSSIWAMAIGHFHRSYGLDSRILDTLLRLVPIDTVSLTAILPKRLYKTWLAAWLNDNMPHVDFHEQWMVEAASENDLKVLRFLHEARPAARCPLEAFTKAYEYRNHDVLCYLLEHQREWMTRDFAKTMIADGRPPLMEVMKKYGSEYDDIVREIVMAQSAWSRTKRMEQLLANGMLTSRLLFSIDGLVAKNEYKATHFLHEKGLATATTEAMDIAAEKKYWRLLQLLHMHRAEGCTTRAMDAVARIGHVQFLKDRRSTGCTGQALDEAAGTRCLALVRLLHEITTTDCTTRAMDNAAANGHLHVVQLLHENCREGCTTYAMDNAAGNGYLEVVQFLHTHRSEGCTVAALHSALRHGHLDIVQFLYAQYPDLFVGRDVLHEVLLFGAFDLWKTLEEAHPEDAKQVDLSMVMEEAGRCMQVPTIRFILTVLGRHDLAVRAMDGAAQGFYMRKEDLGWLPTVFSVTGPQSCRLSAIRHATECVKPQRYDMQKLTFLVSVCSEAGAGEEALAVVKRLNKSSVVADLEVWVVAGQPTTNPPDVEQATLIELVLGPNTPSWVAGVVFGREHGVLYMPNPSLTLAGRAIYRRDLRFVQRLIELPPLESPKNGKSRTANWLSFTSVRAAAIRKGDLETLRWLMVHVPLPVEPTLLDEAIFSNQREIAVWLATNHPEACTKFNPKEKSLIPFAYRDGLDENLLDWVESTEVVRPFIDFGAMACYAANDENLVLLRRLDASYPGLLKANMDDLLGCGREEALVDLSGYFAEIKSRPS